MRRGLALRVGLLAGVLAVAAGVGWVSVRNVTRQLEVLDACDAAAKGDWATTLRGTQGNTGDDETGRAAVECRCMALLATDAGDACVDLLETALASRNADHWTPRPALAVHLIQTRRDRGRIAEAAALARRAAAAHPEDPDLFYLELETRSSVEDEEALLRELARRIPEAGPNAARMRVSLANRYLFRGDAPGALAILGDQPPPDAGAAEAAWWDTRGMALASNDDVAGVIAHYDRWRDAGGDPIELSARYAVTLSIAGIADPRHPPSELLERAWQNVDALRDAKLQEALAIRLILTLVNEDRIERALAIYDGAKDRFPMAGLSRAELQRAATHRVLRESPGETPRGHVHFAVRDPRAGDRLLLSPTPDLPADAPFEPVPIPPNGRVEVEREIGIAPLRWVLRDADDATSASGTVNPVAGARVHVPIERRAAQPPAVHRLAPQPADGDRRVFLLLLDCGDWRLVRYLRARGELPVLGALLREGHRALLDSDPPLTAAALEALVRPTRRSGDSFLGLMHRVGLELAGLASVGRNPFAPLEWLLPEDDDLFAVLGRGDREVANLLLAHGSIRAGRHGEITGPFGATRTLPIAQSARDLHPGERERWPALARAKAGRDAFHVRTIAAELDTAVEIAAEGTVDLLALRIEPLDILTHGHFAATVRDGQDDGAGLLYSVYRYIDARIGELHAALDADDVLIVMSDHGIRTAMEHSRDAMFIAVGPGIPSGRADGRPALRGVGAVLSDLFQVATDWPRTGVAPFSVALPGPSAVVAADESKRDPGRPHLR